MVYTEIWKAILTTREGMIILDRVPFKAGKSVLATKVNHP